VIKDTTHLISIYFGNSPGLLTDLYRSSYERYYSSKWEYCRINSQVNVDDFSPSNTLSEVV
jgi:hypothetical protein